MRRSFVIVLLFGLLVMNVDIICQSLCLSGDNNTADMHTSHKAAKHDMPKSAMCPIIHSADHSSHHIPKTFIKSCSDRLSLKYELTMSEPVKDLRPYPYIVSKTHSHKTIFLINEPVPLENPPEILS
ncbi:MAG: hypothetical protein Q8P28_11085 [Deltaproteobacteria bacterium]|nr:hypothetical protein [Deltaproteobacteria bacterium]